MKKAEANVMRGMFLTKTKTESFKQTEFRTIIFTLLKLSMWCQSILSRYFNYILLLFSSTPHLFPPVPESVL